MYLPPGLASIISAMKDTLAAERAARLRAETRYEQETRLRAAAQRDAEREVRLRVEAEHDAAQLRAENARIQQRHRDWIATTSSTLVENLAQFSERLLAEGIELAFPSTPSASHTLAATQRRGSSSGAAAAVHTMAVDY
ncbi:hypothetical protein PsYK624_020830 [Phanerochaete sordida]|uniref:Uncharacterized protein n=1 Tax=Phanerochaete sordida TaxID=48140 RepID=A0A9P3G0J4_9APHY|nr:hypothetical protein PsYK624_020830 [Phanerochaete sordida]